MRACDMDIERRPAGRVPARIGIVHLGLGAFHRAHQAVYLQQCLDRTGADDWGICSANIRSNRALVDQLRDADMRYHVAEFSHSDSVTVREIGVIREALYAGPDGPDREALIARMSHPDVRIVTLTVTEKGYFLNPASGELLTNAEPIAHDIAEPATPWTAPGLLVAALTRRRRANIAPFAVLCCDNMPENGKRTRRAVISLAAENDAPLAQWIAENVAFPSSMVDRIVPAMTDSDLERLAAIDVDDPAAVVCESFRQWVVEDDFPQGRPDWAADGVEMVNDVTPFETMKLRLLNGAHSLLAYCGSLAGIETVDAAVAHPAYRELLRHYWQREAIPTLTLPAGADATAYTESLLARFGNDSLRHRLIQIAMDGSQKLPQRWLAGAAARLNGGATPPADATLDATLIGIAAWIRFMAGQDLAGHPLAISDPMAPTCAELHRRHAGDPIALVTAFLSLDAIFPAKLRNTRGIVEAIADRLDQFERQGLDNAIERCLGDASTSASNRIP
ncbi:mannitol dehydrogenase family protein [Salinicola rhizosphaerae]|uniref:Mannitol dehydrogenase n=1 Tax=Salinicola rhizosphaerae TaxID=1443141 RepID=A0ABQ3DXP6_9GAMM|nr:mannitol dehydrogenase family protein [Salinicola rhizosphaerae]GHB19732.1 mannitol dehydrogenase [Salinicola rhizosphaerae]